MLRAARSAPSAFIAELKRSAELSELDLRTPNHEVNFSIMPTLRKPRRGVKSLAIKLVKSLPSNATWDDLMYRVYVRQKIESGLSDLDAGRKHSHDDIKRQFGLAS